MMFAVVDSAPVGNFLWYESSKHLFLTLCALSSPLNFERRHFEIPR